MGGQDREQDRSRSSNAVEKRLFIGGKWVDAARRRHLRRHRPLHRRSPVRGGRRHARGRDAPRWTPAVAAQPAFAATSPRERADMLTGAFELLHERIDDLALLMTLEMGKPLAEARGEIAYAAEFFRHFAGRGGAHRRRLPDRAGRRRPLPGGPPAGRPVPADHAVELPDGDGHPQDRSRDRGRLHERRQAGPADAAVDAGADGHPDRGRRARRRGQLRHRRWTPAR